MNWNSSLRLTPEFLSLLVTDQEGNDLLKARLPTPMNHPRALISTLEGLALWSGRPIRGVISVAASSPRSLVSSCFGDDLWPCDSALVQLDFAPPRRRKRLHRIRGLGPFRQLRLAIGDEG